ncbi:MAG: cytochrome ubiquinol oxidase subunit I [candidate division KSB1 bacterium]|nr:cytochrome ubiquinol oxidase subunit I [candidate division KSB1 bacterium]MDZ7334832.1 cytochrome ubiquinol oxidase subunit I [candidate division KSB1 bacterium]MDZ7356538.1 cytochrome ubiquinol oxidase subunit I [candidate division KSB1 bacterium]MDZ7400439.1 cytochrome ubiquinol oxidase subunit I [candidate division KSB1 bacterium]
MDVLTLSRIQFGLTIAFHYIFPPMSIGLSIILIIMEGMYLKTKNELYHQMTRFWVKIFGLIFALGVASGIVMEFQFGTNWATYSRFVGDVFGSALAAEGIFAFFLESGFLAILLFGWNKVKPRTHFISTIMVSFGAHFSAIWIVVANSWQQTPAGHQIVGIGSTARAEIVSFWQMVFNPSSIDRLAHVLCGAWQAGAFLVLSVSAYYLIKKRHVDFAERSFKIGLVVGAIASVLQLISGHYSAIVVRKYQPVKLAAYEAHYPEKEPAPYHLIGWVDEKNEKVYGISVPGLLSFLLSGDPKDPVIGLSSFPPEDRPPVAVVFQTYHAMVIIGVGLIALSWLGLFLWWRKKLFDYRWLLWIFVLSVLGPQFANQLGWFSAEIGRQPWIVYNLLRTEEAYSKTVTAHEVITSLAIFGIIYLMLTVLFIYLLNDKIQHGPVEDQVKEGHLA